MNLWLLACLVTCFIGTWAPAVQAQGIVEDCCLAYHPHLKWTVLRHARSYQHQDLSGSCNLPAVIFKFPHKQRMVCGNPKAKWVKIGMKFLDRNKDFPKHHQAPHKGRKDLSSGTSRLPLSRFRDPTRSREKNASLPTRANPRILTM
ncbi:PREDICTED: C-C motif chemokine 25 [Miniopterus natalensis]|uniref:C-C motif chemokine 25 n=1 Tax=Miniopterus natalensis TaxID=291302 RepID=UPI0007A6F6FC|nr:PREDICTED: C-C motif chemokine 25 [Miniopterus natalensis]XP_016058970.1 PREDICTED: C-C motif chemokine 25 [Miniopterus natalensis]